MTGRAHGYDDAMGQYTSTGGTLKSYWMVCLTGAVAAVAVTAVVSNPAAALFVPFPAVVVIMFTYPWLSPLEAASRSRKRIAMLCCTALVAGLPWMFGWWGLGFLYVPATVVFLALYAFLTRGAAGELWPARCLEAGNASHG